MRPDTWGMFADPAILRFFGQGLLETLSLSIVSVPCRSWPRSSPWPASRAVAAVPAIPTRDDPSLPAFVIWYFGKGCIAFRPIVGPEFDL